MQVRLIAVLLGLVAAGAGAFTLWMQRGDPASSSTAVVKMRIINDTDAPIRVSHVPNAAAFVQGIDPESLQAQAPNHTELPPGASCLATRAESGTNVSRDFMFVVTAWGHDSGPAEATMSQGAWIVRFGPPDQAGSLTVTVEPDPDAT